MVDVPPLPSSVLIVAAPVHHDTWDTPAPPGLAAVPSGRFTRPHLSDADGAVWWSFTPAAFDPDPDGYANWYMLDALLSTAEGGPVDVTLHVYSRPIGGGDEIPEVGGFFDQVLLHTVPGREYLIALRPWDITDPWLASLRISHRNTSVGPLQYPDRTVETGGEGYAHQPSINPGTVVDLGAVTDLTPTYRDGAGWNQAFLGDQPGEDAAAAEYAWAMAIRGGQGTYHWNADPFDGDPFLGPPVGPPNPVYDPVGYGGGPAGVIGWEFNYSIGSFMLPGGSDAEATGAGQSFNLHSHEWFLFGPRANPVAPTDTSDIATEWASAGVSLRGVDLHDPYCTTVGMWARADHLTAADPNDPIEVRWFHVPEVPDEAPAYGPWAEPDGTAWVNRAADGSLFEPMTFIDTSTTRLFSDDYVYSDTGWSAVDYETSRDWEEDHRETTEEDPRKGAALGAAGFVFVAYSKPMADGDPLPPGVMGSLGVGETEKTEASFREGVFLQFRFLLRPSPHTVWLTPRIEPAVLEDPGVQQNHRTDARGISGIGQAYPPPSGDGGMTVYGGVY